MPEIYAAVLIWSAFGVISVFFYWYEDNPLRTKTWGERLLMSAGWPFLGPLIANAALVWNRTRRRGNKDHRRLGIPHCRRHGFILLKCEHIHEAYCAGCSSNRRCPRCGRDAFFSPRFHGRSDEGKPIVIYERIYADPSELPQKR